MEALLGEDEEAELFKTASRSSELRLLSLDGGAAPSIGLFGLLSPGTGLP